MKAKCRCRIETSYGGGHEAEAKLVKCALCSAAPELFEACTVALGTLAMCDKTTAATLNLVRAAIRHAAGMTSLGNSGYKKKVQQ